MHISSLWGEYSEGSLGKAAKEWIDFISDCGFGVWQVLPFCLPDDFSSPYKSYSAFSLNPYFIDLDRLHEMGLLTSAELEGARQCTPYSCEFERLFAERMPLLARAAERFSDSGKIRGFLDGHKQTENFCRFMALRKANRELTWNEWTVAEPDESEQRLWEFTQYIFFEQWKEIREYAHERGVKIIGDIPIYVSWDSADVWSNPTQFLLDARSLPTAVAGVPPDYFAKDGQLWGNPLYDWEKMEQTDFAWWRSRMKASAKLYDAVRIDHFIGVVQYYAIPYGAVTAKDGEWEKGPGKKLTDALDEAAGETKIIAEDLGVFCQEVKDLLAETGYPGMKIIEFAFSGDRFNEHLPHCYDPNSVVYGGTHDNETLAGYFKPEKRQWWELQYIADYLGAAHQSEVVDRVFRAAYGSVASVAIFQMQDVLKLDNWARMNTPGTLGENWRWRLVPGQFTDERADYLSWLVDTFGRF